ncbi:four helix bundle protein [Flavobacteriaceae bacterium R38]|nr:four helix bundle protein [Flavobacteriaceae bacterium R38]
MSVQQKYDLQKQLVKFPALIIKNTDILKKNFSTEHLLRQLIRSVTSAALNYGEAQAAESKNDFIHKMKICLKELRESQVNLQILKETDLIIEKEKFQQVFQECNELVAIFTTSIKTTSKK